MSIEIQVAGPSDANAIAEIHAASWQSTYRGLFSEEYLDGNIQIERQSHWTRRLRANPCMDLCVLMAIEGGTCLGFICIDLQAEPAWGPLLDNLHVRPDRKGFGIGHQLIRAGLAWVKARGAFDRWHLWVVETNTPSRQIYEHLGWAPGERGVHVAPDGTEYPVWRYTQRLTDTN